MGQISVDVQVMKTSAGADYFVRIKCGVRSTTPFMFKERWKAEYEADHLQYVFGIRDEDPDMMDYDEEKFPNTPSPTPRKVPDPTDLER